MVSAFVKIPLQALILLTGVLVFVFYLFVQPPMLFNPVYQARVESSGRAGEYRQLEEQFGAAYAERRQAAEALVAARQASDPARVAAARAAFNDVDGRLKATRGRARTLVREVTGDAIYDDVNYVFPTFVTTQLPMGLVGLIIAAIFAAAMSSIAGEVNSLATTTVIDVYKRHVRREADDTHYLRVSKLATGFWGLVACAFADLRGACGVADRGRQQDGVVLLRDAAGRIRAGHRDEARERDRRLRGDARRVRDRSAGRPRFTSISYLWYNVVGAIVVVAWGCWSARSRRDALPDLHHPSARAESCDLFLNPTRSRPAVRSQAAIRLLNCRDISPYRTHIGPTCDILETISVGVTR